MTWLDLINRLEEQPLCELRKEIIISSHDENGSTDYEIKELAFPMEFCDQNGYVLWDEWKEGGLLPQIMLEVKKVYRYEKKED